MMMHASPLGPTASNRSNFMGEWYVGDCVAGHGHAIPKFESLPFSTKVTDAHRRLPASTSDSLRARFRQASPTATQASRNVTALATNVAGYW